MSPEDAPPNSNTSRDGTTRDYGHTKSGAYMCEAEAQASGNRAAMNERHP